MEFKVKARKYDILEEFMQTLAEKIDSTQQMIDDHFSGMIEDLDYYDKQRRIECESIIAASRELMNELTVKYK